MKLVFLIDSLVIGGKERRCLQLVKELNNLCSSEIHLVLFDDYIGYQEVFSLNVTIHILGRKTKKDVRVFFKLFKLLINIKPDVVLSWSIMSSFWLNFIRCFYKFNYLSAYVANVNKPDKFSLGNIARLMSFVSSKYIIGNSLMGLQEYKVPKKKAVLIYNGYDFTRNEKIRNKDIVRNELQIITPYLVIMVGRVHPSKDYQTFLDVAKDILQIRQDITFLSVGDGPLLNKFKSQIGINEKRYIQFIGYRQNVEEIINASDICVLCSPSEGISNFILESMALGKPVIATNTGGTPEIVKDGINGYLVSHKDSIELKDKIIDLLNSDSKRYELGKQGQNTVLAKFPLDLMTKKFCDLFQKTMNKTIKNK